MSPRHVDDAILLILETSSKSFSTMLKNDRQFLRFQYRIETTRGYSLRLQRGILRRSGNDTREVSAVENFYRRPQARWANQFRFAGERQNNKERNREHNAGLQLFHCAAWRQRACSPIARETRVDPKAKSASESVSAQAQLKLISWS